MRKLRVLVVIFFCTFTLGCASRLVKVQRARASFLSGELAASAREFEKLIDGKPEKNEVLLADQAIVHLVQGDAEKAEALLQQVRDGFDQYEQKDAREWTLSVVTDDLSEAYAGEDYEKILVRNFLAIANLMHDGGDVVPYSLQANAKQHQIIQRLSGRVQSEEAMAFKRVAFSAYLHGAIAEQTHRDYDDAARAFAKVVAWNPDFKSGPKNLNRASTGTHSRPGNGVVYVIALVGAGPQKVETTAPVTSNALAIAGQILNSMEQQKTPAISAPVKIPQIVIPVSNIDAIGVAVDKQPVVTTETVTDVGGLATQQYAASLDQVIAKAVVRRAVKKGAVYQTKKEFVSGNAIAEFALDAAGFLWEASESADTRCWGLLPREIQVARIELPAGEHEISLQPLRDGVPVGSIEQQNIRIQDGRSRFVLAYFPNEKLAGKLNVSSF